MFLIAGPNGAGKTTFYETVLRPRLAAPFVNADIIQRDELKKLSVKAAYEAAEIAAQRRGALIAERCSFVTESVFSHPSKLSLLADARSAGFRIILFHLHLNSAELAVARVAERVREGGHAVPDEKVRARYARNQLLIKKAVMLADAAAVYDASTLNTPPRMLWRIASRVTEFLADDRPTWFDRLYGDVAKAPV